MPTFPEQKRAAEKFASEWLNRTGYEKGETATFWIQLLREVFGLADAEKHIIFEDRVQIEHTNFIDARIPKSRVLIEQKSADIDLDAKQKQSDGALLTPLQQAQRYVLGLPLSAHPRYIVVCNFLNFQIHDCETRETDIIPLAEFPKNHSRMAFLITPPPMNASPAKPKFQKPPANSSANSTTNSSNATPTRNPTKRSPR